MPRFTFIFAAVLAFSSTALAQEGWSSQTSAPTYVWGNTMVACNGQAYSIGDQSGSPAPVYRFDPATNSWSRETDLPIPAYWGGAALVGSTIYYIGNEDRDDGRIYAYNTVNRTWALMTASIPTRTYGTNVAAIGNRIYVVSHIGVWSLPSDFHVFDASTQSVTALPSLPACTRMGNLEAIGTKLYYCGGTDELTADPVASAACFQFDPAIGQWQQKTNMPLGRFRTSSFVADGRLFVLGGQNSWDPDPNDPMNELDEYDPAWNTWTVRTPIPNRTVIDAGACVIGGVAYVYGGGRWDLNVYMPAAGVPPPVPTPTPTPIPQPPVTPPSAPAGSDDGGSGASSGGCSVSGPGANLWVLFAVAVLTRRRK